jgi:microcystin degradation protein MlrC
MTQNPQIKQLAAEAAQKIKQLANAHNSEIEAVYRDFRNKAEALQKITSADDLDNPSAGGPPNRSEH